MVLVQMYAACRCMQVSVKFPASMSVLSCRWSFEALLSSDCALRCAKVCFMPNQGCKEGMEILGAWCFIVGAGCYMLGDFIELMLLD